MSALDRAVLRSAVGDDNYPAIERVCDELDQLERRQAIGGDGLDRIIQALAEELVAQRLAVDVANEVVDTTLLEVQPE